MTEINESLQEHESLRSSEEILRLLLEHAPSSIAMFDREMRYLTVSRRWMEDFSFGDKDIIGVSHYELFPEIPEGWKKVHRRCLAGETIRADEDRFERIDGTIQWLRWEVLPWHLSDGAIGGIIIFSEDITRYKQAEFEIRQLNVVLEQREAELVIANKELVFQSGEKGKRAAELVIANVELAHQADEKANRAAELVIANEELVYQSDEKAKRAEEFQDVKEEAESARELAFYDALTSLPNRRLLNDRLTQAMLASKRSGCYSALLFLDLDNFKPLNDKHGHGVGDLLLIEAANRIKSCVREIDTVARFGGDEFVVLLSELNTDKAESISDASIISEKIHTSLSEPYFLTRGNEGKADSTIEHHSTASIGVVLFINHEVSLSTILKHADSAMYKAKEAGRNQIRFYEEHL